ncbi:hypothetical protein KEM52_001950, partial [Ascosphaera acerosa]
PFQRRRRRVHLHNHLVRHLDQLRARPDRRPGDDPALLRHRRRLDDRHVQLAPGLVHRVPPVHQVRGEHAQVLVEEVDVAVVDPLGDVAPHLVRRPPLDHVQLRPPVLRVCPRARPHEQVVLQLALQVVLLHVVGQRLGDHPGRRAL